MSLDVKTAFDAATPLVVSKVTSLTGVDGHAVAALLAGMQLELWGDVPKYVTWKGEEIWKANGWGLAFERKYEDEYLLRCMM